MNIVCISKYENASGKKYQIGHLYNYNLNETTKFYTVVYYTIYDENNTFFGYATKESIDRHFTGIYDYNKELKILEQIFDFYMEGGYEGT